MTHDAAPCGLSVRKQTIARHFAQACQYEQHANVQQHVCQLLLTNITRQQQDSVLEIGAGTGQMTRLLVAHLKSKHWLINELCERQATTLQSILPSVLASEQASVKVAIGDAETMNLGDAHSLIVSANAVQWFDNPLSIIEQSYGRLQSGGQLLFNTFTPNNFMQIKALTGQGLPYPTIDDWQRALDNAGFVHVQLSTYRFDLQFLQPYEVLKHMKLTGVSTNQTQTPIQATSVSTKPFVWTKARMKEFETNYWQQFSVEDSSGQPCVTLTYEVLIVTAVKL